MWNSPATKWFVSGGLLEWPIEGFRYDVTAKELASTSPRPRVRQYSVAIRARLYYLRFGNDHKTRNGSTSSALEYSAHNRTL